MSTPTLLIVLGVALIYLAISGKLARMVQVFTS